MILLVGTVGFKQNLSADHEIKQTTNLEFLRTITMYTDTPKRNSFKEVDFLDFNTPA